MDRGRCGHRGGSRLRLLVPLSAPLYLKPRPVERVWGGRKLERLLSRELPPGDIGESWEIFGELEVSQGIHQGRTLDALIEQFGERLLGAHSDPGAGFPILTKWLDCRSWLSVQVHPDDPLAQELTGDPLARGKSECWYFLEVEDGAEVIHCDRLPEPFEPERLERYRPRSEELLMTAAGTIHALGPGIVLYEIQQSSDLTYRFYDWGRDRPLHLEEAGRSAREARPSPLVKDRGRRVGKVLTECAYFVVEMLQGETDWRLDGGSFEILAAVGEKAELIGAFGTASLEFGSSVVLPAQLGEVKLNSPGRVLRVRVP